jgi:hypothetical protein
LFRCLFMGADLCYRTACRTMTATF